MMTSDIYPPKIVHELWDSLLKQLEMNEPGQARETACQLEILLTRLPSDKAGSMKNPGIDGMLRFAVICEQLDRLEEAIGWQTQRVELLAEFIRKDPANSLELFTREDLMRGVISLAKLYQKNGQPEKAELILDEYSESTGDRK